MSNYYSWAYNNNLVRMDETAVYAGDFKYSFRDIFDMADAIAGRLTGMGLCRGDFIIASMMPSPEGIAIILACSKLDVCCMTLLPGADDERLLSFINNENVKFAFIEEVFLGVLHGLPRSVDALETVFAMPHDKYLSEADRVSIDYRGEFSFVKTWDDFLSGTVIPSETVNSPKSPVYIAATPDHNNPKGIMYSHDAMIAAAKMLVDSQQNAKPGMIMHSRIPMFTAAGNSMETMSPFAGGISIATGQVPMADGKCIPEEFEKFSPNLLMIAKTSILQAMDNPLMSELDFSRLTSLYNIGEPLSEEEKQIIGEFFMSRGAKTTIRNAYGLSESNCILTAEAPSSESSKTVGYPVPGALIRIVDPDTILDVEAGTPGEIIYSAPCMMDGYFKDEEATTKRLFKSIDGKTYDRTGDLGCLDADGNLHILGRVDERYKNDGGKTRYFFEITETVRNTPGFDSAYLVSVGDDVYIHYTGTVADATVIRKLRERLIRDDAYHMGHFLLKHWEEVPTSGGRVRSYLLAMHTEDAVLMDDFEIS